MIISHRHRFIFVKTGETLTAAQVDRVARLFAPEIAMHTATRRLAVDLARKSLHARFRGAPILRCGCNGTTPSAPSKVDGPPSRLGCIAE